VWENNCSCSVQPFEVFAAGRPIPGADALDAARVLLVAGNITRWTGCQACRLEFASLLERAIRIVRLLEDEAVKRWTELD